MEEVGSIPTRSTNHFNRLELEDPPFSDGMVLYNSKTAPRLGSGGILILDARSNPPLSGHDLTIAATLDTSALRPGTFAERFSFADRCFAGRLFAVFLLTAF
jgi:hypothetical protein